MGAVLVAEDFASHPDVVRCTPAAIGHWLSMACAASRTGATDGVVPDHQVRAVPIHYRHQLLAAGLIEHVDALVSVGLVSEDGAAVRLAHGKHNVRELWRIERSDRRAPIPDGLRFRVYERDGWACLHCGATTQLTVDHVHPWSLGGPDTFENLQTLCRSCNSRKGARV